MRKGYFYPLFVLCGIIIFLLVPFLLDPAFSSSSSIKNVTEKQPKTDKQLPISHEVVKTLQSRTTPLKAAIMVSPKVAANDDKSFIQGVIRGAERAAKEASMELTVPTPKEGQDETAFITSIAESGVEVVIALSFVNFQALLDVAEKHPNVKFMVIDGVVPPFYPNVKSIIFREHEGSFLVGVIAALKSSTGKIGFVGGRDGAIVRNFAWGFKQGARHVNPKIVVFEDTIGNGPDAWDNPAKAEELAELQYNKGADVIFAAAGGSSVGVLKASADKKGRYSIGVDINQNALYPGHVLTSMLKKVDAAVYSGLINLAHGTWDSTTLNVGLKDDALSYVIDENNKDLFNPAMIAVVENARQQIIAGTIDVKMYAPYQK